MLLFFQPAMGLQKLRGNLDQSITLFKKCGKSLDKNSPKFSGQKVLPIAEFESKLGVKLAGTGNIGEVTEFTAGKRVAKVDISGKEISGKDIREKLDPVSTDFDGSLKVTQIVMNTQSYGNGVGMSQYGANGMAEEGKKYQDIVQYYYQGVEIQPQTPFITTITAKK